LCLQAYHFTYDVRYPIVIHLAKENVLSNGDSLILRFALPIQIQQNKPDDSQYISFDYEKNNFDEQLCNDVSRIPTTITVRQAGIDQPMIDADVEYQCFNYYCPLGKTQIENGYAQLTTHIPQWCSASKIIASKTNYVTSVVNITNDIDSLHVYLYPLKNVKVSVVSGPSNPLDAYSDLSAGVQASITFNAIGIDYQTTALVNAQNTTAIVQLLDASSSYNVSVTLFDENLELIGGYSDVLNVQSIPSGSTLRFHALDFINPPSSNEELFERVEKLETDSVYKQNYQAVWVR
jgi:hypothetical protein